MELSPRCPPASFNAEIRRWKLFDVKMEIDWENEQIFHEGHGLEKAWGKETSCLLGLLR